MLKHNNRNRAFTLIEVLAATAMLGISMTFLLTCLSTVNVGSTQLGLRGQALRAMYNAADIYRFNPMTSLGTSGATPINTAVTSTPTIVQNVSGAAGPEWRVNPIYAGQADVRLVRVRKVAPPVGVTLPYDVHELDFAYEDVDGMDRYKTVKVVLGK